MFTIEAGARTWYGRRTWSVCTEDETGRIMFHGYTRRGAECRSRALTAAVGNRPVGPIANLMAQELLHEPRAGKKWTAKLSPSGGKVTGKVMTEQQVREILARWMDLNEHGEQVTCLNTNDVNGLAAELVEESQGDH